MTAAPEGWLTTEQMAEKINAIYPNSITGQSIRICVRKDEKHHSQYVTKIGKTWYVSPEWPRIEYWESKAKKELSAQNLREKKNRELIDLKNIITELQAIIDKQRKTIDSLERQLDAIRRPAITNNRGMTIDEAKALMNTVQEWQGSQRSLAKHLGMAESTLRGRIKKARQVLA